MRQWIVIRANFLVAIASCTLACSSPDEPEIEPINCLPGAAEATWLQEGDSVAIEVGCQGEATRSGDELAMIGLPAGATFDTTESILRWTPGLDQAAVWNLEVEVIETGEIGVVVVGVADAFDDPQNIPVLDPLAYPLEYGVPVLFLSVGPSQSEVDEPLTVTYNGRAIPARGEKRGASSLSYPKNSYLLKFENDDQFYDIDREFVAKRRVVLTSTFDDNAYLRQRLAFDLWNSLEPTMPIETYSVVVYIAGEYWGLYTLTDHPSKHWLEGLGLNPDANLYKAFNHDANFRSTDNGGDLKSKLSQGFEKKNGLPTDDFADLDNLVDFSITATDAEFGAGLGDRVVTSDYNKWWALVVFTLAGDSAGKNSYHYHDGGKWQVAPWDFNASFGQSWETSRTDVTAVDQYQARNELFRRSLEHATLGPTIRAELIDAMTTGPFSPEVLNARVDEIVGEIDASARRDWRKWSADYATHPRWSGRSDLNDYDGELTYLREWLTARHAAIRSVIN